MAANCRSNAALGTGTATILAITSDQQADQNPPEQLITSAVIRTKLKTLLRKAQARTSEALLSAIATLMQRFDPGECENYIRNSGYCGSG
jgi:mannose/fructose/N-acetylgalactosamine-specific phosphotransferase system component IIC